MKVGTRDASLFYHAGLIALKAQHRAAAIGYLKQSLELNPHSEVAASVRDALEVARVDAATAPAATRPIRR